MSGQCSVIADLEFWKVLIVGLGIGFGLGIEFVMLATRKRQ